MLPANLNLFMVILRRKVGGVVIDGMEHVGGWQEKSIVIHFVPKVAAYSVGEVRVNVGGSPNSVIFGIELRWAVRSVQWWLGGVAYILKIGELPEPQEGILGGRSGAPCRLCLSRIH